LGRILLIMARAIDYRIGRSDEDVPDIPNLRMFEAWLAFFIKLSIIMINFITCAFVIANIIHHW
jgi:hypothetical protein